MKKISAKHFQEVMKKRVPHQGEHQKQAMRKQPCPGLSNGGPSITARDPPSHSRNVAP